MHVVNGHTTIALIGSIIRPMYATTVYHNQFTFTLKCRFYLCNIVTPVHVTYNPFIGVICYIEVTRLKIIFAQYSLNIKKIYYDLFLCNIMKY